MLGIVELAGFECGQNLLLVLVIECRGLLTALEVNEIRDLEKRPSKLEQSDRPAT